MIELKKHKRTNWKRLAEKVRGQIRAAVAAALKKAKEAGAVTLERDVPE